MSDGKPKYHIVSLSGGKDSTAMLLHMLELGMPVDEICFCDTGMEFPQMYEHLKKVEAYIRRPITYLKPEHSFEWYLRDVPVTTKRTMSKTTGLALPDHGYGMPGRKFRWCTSRLKNDPRKKHIRALSEKCDVVQYVGLAADETERLARPQNQDCRHPLAEWGWTEAQCLQYCYDHGFTWGGLYEGRSGLSCWCCPLQPYKELKMLWRGFPDLWAKLQEWGNYTYWRNFRSGYRVEHLAARFAFEDEWEARGYACKGRAFYNALYEYLAERFGGEWRDKIQPTKAEPYPLEGATHGT